MKARYFQKSDWGMLLSSVLLLAISSAWAQNPMPFINVPLFPESLAPGGTSFILTVDGSGFFSASVVEWNGAALPSTFVSSDRLTTNVPGAYIASPGVASITVSNAGVISNVAYFEITNPTNSTSFNQSHSVTLVPYSIAAPSLYGDGGLDLAVANLNHGTLSTLLSNGEGKFHPAVPYAVENGPSSVGHFNGGGDLDPPAVNEADDVLTEHASAQSSSAQAAVVNTDSRESSQAEPRIEAITTRPIQWYRDAAAQGSLEAVFILGWLYQNGQGVHRDYRQAVVYYRAAAERGHAVAENNLAAMYETGNGVSKNLGEATRWYRAAAEQGLSIAQFNLASLFFFGKGVPRDYSQSARWLRAAADQGDVPAEIMLCTSYYYGYGVGVDFSQAAKWARRAADQGDARGQAELGFLYQEGKGVPLDYVAAYKWYSLAQQAGDKNSRASIKNLLRVMTPTQVSQARAMPISLSPGP